jgi:hypothetical protein
MGADALKPAHVTAEPPGLSIPLEGVDARLTKASRPAVKKKMNAVMTRGLKRPDSEGVFFIGGVLRVPRKLAVRGLHPTHV